MRRPLTALFVAVLLALGACSSGSDGKPDAGKPTSSAASTSASPTPVEPAGALKRTFFGVHDSDPVATWPTAPVGSLRVWDSGVAWRQIETSPGTFDFSRLDAIVQTARANKAEPLIVLGQTPEFYATTPSPEAAYGPGASSMPKLGAWRKYVRAVVQRYQAPDVQFQVWNEANVINYWSGTPAQMARLTAAAAQVIDSIDPSITLVAPAFPTRLPSQARWIDDFYGQSVDGKPVGDYIDVVSLQLYPLANQPAPEIGLDLLRQDRAILAKHHVDKPIWNTEINYGLRGGLPVSTVGDKEQATKVATTYLLNAGAGIQRVYWYSWDLHKIADTVLTEDDLVTPTAAGRAFMTVEKWLRGTKPQGCKQDSSHTYTCTFDAVDGSRRVLWNPERSVQVDAPAGASTSEKLIGRQQQLTAGASMDVGPMPILVRSASGR